MSMTISGTSGLTFPSAVVQGNAGLGYSQTWQNVTASRATGVTYTNSTGRPICVATTYYGVGQMGATVSGAVIYVNGNSTGYNNGNFFIVPPGATYSMDIQSGGQALALWYELR